MLAFTATHTFWIYWKNPKNLIGKILGVTVIPFLSRQNNDKISFFKICKSVHILQQKYKIG